MGVKQAIVIATVKYRYAKIGPCYTQQRHRPSYVWTISNGSRPTIQRTLEHNFTPLTEIKSNWIGSRSLRYGRPRITTPAQDQYIQVFHLRNRTVAATPLLLVSQVYGEYPARQSVTGFANAEFGQEDLKLDQF